MSVDPPRPSLVVRPVARSRTRMQGGRLNCLNVRLTDEEMSVVSAAAARAGLTPTGFVAEGGLAAARAEAQGSVAGATRAELAGVQREVFAAQSALVCAARSAGGPVEVLLREAVERLDGLAERVHGLLKRVSV